MNKLNKVYFSLVVSVAILGMVNATVMAGKGADGNTAAASGCANSAGVAGGLKAGTSYADNLDDALQVLSVLNEKEEEISAKKNEVLIVAEEINRLEKEKINSLQKEINKLKGKIEKKEAKAKDASGEQSELSTKQSEMDQYIDERDTLKCKLTTAEQEVKLLENQKVTLENKLKELKKSQAPASEADKENSSFWVPGMYDVIPENYKLNNGDLIAWGGFGIPSIPKPRLKTKSSSKPQPAQAQQPVDDETYNALKSVEEQSSKISEAQKDEFLRKLNTQSASSNE